jgi:CheY-like chemotaxis protein
MFLIAEDDPDDQFIIQTVADEVCPPDVQIRFVENGVELLDFLQEQANDSTRSDLIMLDLNMPRKDGREALKDIKNDPGIANIPTVILTTSNREEDVAYCQSLGIAGYYRKPGSFLELREIIGKLCDEFLKSHG